MKRRIEYPRDPEWYRHRTAAEVAAVLGCNAKHVHNYCRYHNYPLQKDNKYTKYQRAAEWYAARTVPQIARALQVPREYVEKYIRRHGIAVKPLPAVKVCKEEPVPLFGRDDVRYTDEVIATLRSGLHRTDIAERLRIPVADVVFHYQETQGIKIPANTAVVPAVVPDFETKNKRNPAAQCAFFPNDRSWYATRTVQQIASELGTQLRVVQRYVARHGIAVIPTPEYSSMLAMIAATLPVNPAWYASRAIADIAEQYGLPYRDVQKWVQMRGFATKGMPAPVLRRNMPSDPEWYRVRTLRQIAAATGAAERYARLWCTVWGYSYIRTYRRAAQR